jgi:hypothetical protein
MAAEPWATPSPARRVMVETASILDAALDVHKASVDIAAA